MKEVTIFHSLFTYFSFKNGVSGGKALQLCKNLEKFVNTCDNSYFYYYFASSFSSLYTPVQKFGVSCFLSILLFSKDAFNVSKSKFKVSWFLQKYYTAQLFSKLIIPVIRNYT